MILFLVGLLFALFGAGFYVIGSRRHYRAEKYHELLSRPGPQPKAVPPFPFGTISDLIKDAEAKAEKEFYELFPEERPPSDPPGGYSMDSSPDGIIISNSVMTPNEWRERYANLDPGQPMILDENTTYRSLQSRPNEDTTYRRVPPRPVMHDIATLGRGYARYIEGIGIIGAETRQQLLRACEVALMEKFREYEQAMRAHDTLIRSAILTGHTMDLTQTKEERHDAWENCKLYLGLLQRLNL